MSWRFDKKKTNRMLNDLISYEKKQTNSYLIGRDFICLKNMIVLWKLQGKCGLLTVPDEGEIRKIKQEKENELNNAQISSKWWCERMDEWQNQLAHITLCMLSVWLNWVNDKCDLNRVDLIWFVL